MNWKWYEDGVLMEVPEETARHAHDGWKWLSNERAMMTVMIDQLWKEIDRLRSEIEKENK